MVSNANARPKSQDKTPELGQARSHSKPYMEFTAYDYAEEGESDATIIVTPKDVGNHVDDNSHQKDKQVAMRKREAVEVAPGDQIRQKAMKYKHARISELCQRRGAHAVNVRPKNSEIWKGGNVATLLHQRTGYVADLSSPTTGTLAVQRFTVEKAAMSPVEQAATYTAQPVLESSPEFAGRDAKGNHETDESRVLKYAAKKESNASAQTQAFARSQLSRARSPARWDIEENGQSRRDGEGASVDAEHLTSTVVGPPMESEDGRYPGWQEFLDFMELSKSRLLEDESSLRFLRSLEPRITGGGHWYFEPHTLFLGLARVANVSKRRERFEEYLVEAPREWYCLTTVSKQGYESEHALASENNCGCPQSQKTCLQARIRRGKLGAFDVRFR